MKIVKTTATNGRKQKAKNRIEKPQPKSPGCKNAKTSIDKKLHFH